MHPKSTYVIYWHRTRYFTFITLLIWAIFSFAIHWFGAELNEFSFLGFPLGYYMAAQGAPLAFVVLLYVSTMGQEKIDDESGFGE